MPFTLGHWGITEIVSNDGDPISRPWPDDATRSDLGSDQFSESLHSMRVSRPSVRQSYLQNGPGARAEQRGNEPFIEVSWDDALDLLAAEIQRVRDQHGNRAIYGGSYGWGSAGRFHHPQSQIHRFLNSVGGYVKSKDSYSHGAGNVILPHVIGSLGPILDEHTSWDVMARETKLFIAFGGVPTKNSQVTAGGVGRHTLHDSIRAMSDNGTHFVNISPQRGDFDAAAATWMPIRPNTDTALMLALAHCLVEEKLFDQKFLERYCVGAEQFIDYLTGKTDGNPKSASWAAGITGVPADDIRSLARQAAATRTMINVSWSLQRADHGEQPYWAVVALACMLGQIGLPGGGVGFGYGAMNSVGSSRRRLSGPTLSQGRNPVSEFIPVARIADMLLHPGEEFRYNGATLTYPDIKLVYWAGGNPFHHHQDLNRLIKAFRRPETIVIHEQFWTATAKMADIVLPITTTAERNDIGYAAREGFLVPMKKLQQPFGEARSDFDVFCGLADRLGVGSQFSEGLNETEWLRRMFDEFRSTMASRVELPQFDEFWEGDVVDFGQHPEPIVLLSSFRESPEDNPLSTPSGRIELFSEVISSYRIAKCPGHASWIEPEEWLGSATAQIYPLHLITNQPKHRLHSQLDHGPYSVSHKKAGREVMTMHSADARRRSIRDDDVVRVFNDRGAFLCAVHISDDITPGVVAIPTGAWFDPADWNSESPLDKHGNPNVLTADRGTSELAQGCSALSCLVDVEIAHDHPEITAHCRPEIIARES